MAHCLVAFLLLGGVTACLSGQNAKSSPNDSRKDGMADAPLGSSARFSHANEMTVNDAVQSGEVPGKYSFRDGAGQTCILTLAEGGEFLITARRCSGPRQNGRGHWKVRSGFILLDLVEGSYDSMGVIKELEIVRDSEGPALCITGKSDFIGTSSERSSCFRRWQYPVQPRDKEYY